MRTKLLYLALLSTITFYSQTQIGADIDGEVSFDNSGLGLSISSDGTTVAVGAYRNDGNGSNSGHVRVFTNVSGVWIQAGQDIDGESAGDESGYVEGVSLSSDGSKVAISSIRNATNGSSSGHVRVFSNESGAWTQIGQNINGEAAYDQSGNSISLSDDGSTVAIGAWKNDGNGTDSGHVRVYQNQTSVWTQVGQDIDGESSGDASGYSVSLSSNGNIVAIGAVSNYGTSTSGAYGHVRVYENQSGVWTQVGQDIDGEALYDSFGYCVSLSSNGTIVAISSPKNDGGGNLAGHVRVFENQAGVWTQIGDDIDGESGSQAGTSISLNDAGNVVSIGAPFYHDGTVYNVGQVRIYQNLNGVWTKVGNDILGEASQDNSGISVSLSGDGTKVAIGAHGNDGGGDSSGHVRVYDLSGILSLEDNEISKMFNVFPNPVINNLKLQLSDSKEFKIATIYNYFGQFVLQSKTTEIDVNSLSSGVYFLEVETDKGKGVKRIIKK